MEHGSAKTALNILCLEDNMDDRELMEQILASEGLDCRFVHVETRDGFETALEQKQFNLILSDYSLPAFDGIAALALARELQPETPFVFVSGTIGEERAVESLKAGATDCVLKDNLARLAPVVHRALGEVTERAKRKSAEDALRVQSGQLRALTARVLASREEERIGISREIHDELGEALTGLKLGLTWIRRRLETADKTPSWTQVFAKMDELGSLADNTAERVRRICAELRPNVLDELGLVPAIQWQAREFEARTGIHCSVRAPGRVLNLREESATAIFRIFQEILTNVARHAQATRVMISLKTTPTHLDLRVADNGRGIEPHALASNESLGLLGMRERATLLGGELAIRGLPGQGTTVNVIIPVGTSSTFRSHNHRPPRSSA